MMESMLRFSEAMVSTWDTPEVSESALCIAGWRGLLVSMISLDMNQLSIRETCRSGVETCILMRR